MQICLLAGLDRQAFRISRGPIMTLRTLFVGLLILTQVSITGANQGTAPNLEDDAKVLAGKWEPTKPMGAGKVVLTFQPGKAKEAFVLIAELYDIRGKEPKFVDSDRGETKLQEDKGKRFFVREGTKVSYILKAKRLVLDGEYAKKDTLYLLTGEWKKVEEKK